MRKSCEVENKCDKWFKTPKSILHCKSHGDLLLNELQVWSIISKTILRAMQDTSFNECLGFTKHKAWDWDLWKYSSHFRRCLCNSKIHPRYDDGGCHKIALPLFLTPCWYVGHIVVFFFRNLCCVGSMSGGTFLMESMPGYPLPISPHILPMFSFCSLFLLFSLLMSQHVLNSFSLIVYFLRMLFLFSLCSS